MMLLQKNNWIILELEIKDIDLKNSYNINNSKTRTFNQLKANDESLVNFEEVKENFVGIHEAEAMKTYLDMGTNFIYSVKTPTNNDEAANQHNQRLTQMLQTKSMLMIIK